MFEIVEDFGRRGGGREEVCESGVVGFHCHYIEKNVSRFYRSGILGG